jgi:hypothetical protein
MFSRMAPKPIPSISGEIQLASDTASEADACLVGTISIRMKVETQVIPCLVDRLTGRPRFFHNGRWLASDEWLKTAPLP